MSITVSVLSLSADMKNFMAVSVSADKKIEFIGLYGYGSYTDPRCTFLLQNGKKDRITKMSVKL